jgi:hypothetical protein
VPAARPLRLQPQELRPARAIPARRGIDPGALEDLPEQHASGVQPVTVTATDWRSTPRSNDGQTILEVTWQLTTRLLTWTFCRDGGIRTRGLLLPNQLQPVA